ncbi:hypothetical protein K438DRAFT_1785777 [Mycena galopus ATCC 62051]|nr:hypothetical protein K438DRAFT_1785777 [Mycena galopus ATCC 62051]
MKSLQCLLIALLLAAVQSGIAKPMEKLSRSPDGKLACSSIKSCDLEEAPVLKLPFRFSQLLCRAARRGRRAGSTGPVRRVTDPFRQGFWKFFDGTVTGRLFKTTAVKITAVDGGRRATGSCTENR